MLNRHIVRSKKVAQVGKYGVNYGHVFEAHINTISSVDLSGKIDHGLPHTNLILTGYIREQMALS